MFPSFHDNWVERAQPSERVSRIKYLCMSRTRLLAGSADVDVIADK